MAPKSWLPVPDDSHFSLANIPFGIIIPPSSTTPRPAVAIGNHVLDLEVFSSHGGFNELPSAQDQLVSVFSQPTLNDFAALGRPFHRQVREYLQDVLSNHTSYPHILKDNFFLRGKALVSLQNVQTCLPMKIGAYTDFFAGKNHAYNCGVIFRGVENALQPNYLHLPVGYSSRASSVVPSGTFIRRPLGQILENPTIKKPILAPCRRLDIELELGVFLCKPNRMGEPIPIEDAEDYLFGAVLLNDWSARDIQTWEAVPLGPFNAKNFGSSVSTWVVLMDALEPFKTEGITNEVQLLPHLQEKQKRTIYDINLSVDLTSKCFQRRGSTNVEADKRLLHSRLGSNSDTGTNQWPKPRFLLFANARTPHRRRLPNGSWRHAWIRNHKRNRTRDVWQSSGGQQRRERSHQAGWRHREDVLGRWRHCDYSRLVWWGWRPQGRVWRLLWHHLLFSAM